MCSSSMFFKMLYRSRRNSPNQGQKKKHGDHGGHDRGRQEGHGHRQLLPKSSTTGISSSSAEASSSTGVSSTTSFSSVHDMLPDRATIFSYREIAMATENFSSSRLIGRSVWKARLQGVQVAISRKEGCAPRLPRVLGRIHSLHHSSLIRLLGACKHGEFVYLVYEFMESSTLRDCLRSKHASGYSPLSSWLSRLQIAVDVAKGLEYLHHLSSSTVIHKYIHSRNVLVGHDLRAKLAHVGVAALTGELPDYSSSSNGKLDESNQDVESQSGIISANSILPFLEDNEYQRNSSGDHSHDLNPGSEDVSQRQASRSQNVARPSNRQSMKIRGTIGYMPPEYTISGEVTTKYDVFCFGVLLAEILSGKEVVPASTQSGMRPSLLGSLASAVSGADAKGKLRLWMDPLLRDSYPVDDALKVAFIATSCVHSDPSKRPEMLTIVLDLQKLLTSAKKYDAEVAAQRGAITSTLQAR